MSDDLIKSDDVLSMIDAFERDFEQSWRVQFSADIKALPAVPTHRYAGESEASVYDRKGFPPIGLQGHAHAPVADSLPADPAAIRDAALQARIEQLERGMDALQDRLDAANKARADANFRANENQFKLAEAMGSLQKISRHANRSCSAIAARALTELEKAK